jgi:two-component system, chemotaxis family, sensor kinase CheA
MDDLRDEFIAETRETLEALASQLVVWEKNPDDKALIDSVFRFIHTVKGSCGFLNLPRLSSLSHAAEDVLSAVRDNRLTVNQELVSSVLAIIDRISSLTDALATGSAIFDDDAILIGRLSAALPGFEHSDASVSEPATEAAPALENQVSHELAPARTRSVRVSLMQLDKLMVSVSDLVLSRNELSRKLRGQGHSAELDQAFSRVTGSVAEIRDTIGAMRTQHIDRLFASIPRLLRDLGIDLGKSITCTVDGGQVEIDREMVDVLRDPITHIIRNAADHGIESPDDRILAGKDPAGHIQISARQNGNQIVIEVRDDGRGVSLTRLKEQAISRKLVTEQGWNRLSDTEKLRMILAPGLSTAPSVTAVSGRGVGMDVVRNNLEAIGASIELENIEGKGFTIALRLPLTLSIIAGLSMRCGGMNFAMSRNSVAEILALSSSHVQIENVAGYRLAKVRGKRMPCARLEDILEMEAAEQGHQGRTLIIIRPARGAEYALDVEAVVDTEELVVKPCAPLVMASGLYAGTTLPDDGRPMLLLDASGIARDIGAGSIPISEPVDDVLESVNPADDDDAISVLVFENLDGKRLSLPLEIVDRIEDFEAGKIHNLDSRWMVSTDSGVHEVIGISELPSQEMVKMLRLFDGYQFKFYAVRDVIDIQSVVPEQGLATPFSSIQNIVMVDDMPIELLSPFAVFGNAGTCQSRPLCLIDVAQDDGWARNILKPLLVSSGYDVSFDTSDKVAAAVVIGNAPDVSNPADPRSIVLRDGPAPLGNDNSIYRYDRLSLMTAIDARVARKTA